MVQLPTNQFDLEAFYDLAGSQGFEYWIGLGVNTILSTIIGGIILIIIIELLGKKFGEAPQNPARAFLLVLLVNLITFFGLLGVGIPVLTQIGVFGLVVQALIWIILVKLFFSEFSILHAVIIGVIGYFATTFIAGLLAGYIGGFLVF